LTARGVSSIGSKQGAILTVCVEFWYARDAVAGAGAINKLHGIKMYA